MMFTFREYHDDDKLNMTANRKLNKVNAQCFVNV